MRSASRFPSATILGSCSRRLVIIDFLFSFLRVRRPFPLSPISGHAISDRIHLRCISVDIGVSCLRRMGGLALFLRFHRLLTLYLETCPGFGTPAPRVRISGGTLKFNDRAFAPGFFEVIGGNKLPPKLLAQTSRVGKPLDANRCFEE